MFYVTLKMSNEMEKSAIEQAHGSFTEGRQYPVLEVSNSNLLGLLFLLADDNGGFRYYKPDLCKFASMDGESATESGKSATRESRQR